MTTDYLCVFELGVDAWKEMINNSLWTASQNPHSKILSAIVPYLFTMISTMAPASLFMLVTLLFEFGAATP